MLGWGEGGGVGVGGRMGGGVREDIANPHYLAMQPTILDTSNTPPAGCGDSTLPPCQTGNTVASSFSGLK
jgi:hypothetical protein